jgi:hypothetical protein
MPMIPPGGPPLHALLTIVVSDTARFTQGNTSGTITITRPSGEVIARGPLTLDQQVDDLGMAQPGPQTLTFVLDRTSLSVTLVKDETLTGNAELVLNQKKVNLKLPETPVEFTY